MSRVSRRIAAVAAVVCVVVGVVSVASAAPQPGKSCKVAGRERVTSAGTLRCVASSGRSLRWVQVAAPVAATTTTTTTSSTTTTVAASARAPQVGAISADDSRVRFTLSGMSPDTGNYAVQWVDKGQSFNTYRMLRVTDKNVSISTAEFACGGSTYTFRVFVMRAEWQLSDGHQRQNVTPHTEPFDVTTVHACPTTTTVASTTTTVAPLSCAAGGTCAVGDTGPGGGTVFYVHPSGTFSCGIGLNSTCKYLEAAPYRWNGANLDPTTLWCNVDSDLNVDESGIGGGLANTTKADDTCTSGAIQTVASYTNNGLGDWYVPSAGELNELCKFARGQTTGNSSTRCNDAGSLKTGYMPDLYWSSTEGAIPALIRLQLFTNGDQGTDGNKAIGPRAVRPIRAFGGTTGCADGGTCAVGDTGPGGGIVFYVHSSGTFTSTGSDCGTSCKYLEAARSDQSTGVVWCSNNSSLLGVTATAIGSGMANTTTADTTCTSGAIQIAADYSNNGKTDWHLPSSNELDALYSARTTVGGFANAAYYSSSEATNSHVYMQAMDNGDTFGSDKNRFDIRVRVVRAFG